MKIAIAVLLLSASALAADCQVRTYFAHDVSGGRCIFNDEVMVGISKLEPLTVRCAKLEVRCNRPEEAIESDGDTSARR